MLSWLKKIFSKEEDQPHYSGQFYTIEWADEAIRHGSFDPPFSKEIRLHIEDEIKKYPYSISIIEALDKEQIPGIDLTSALPSYPKIYETIPEALKEVKYGQA